MEHFRKDGLSQKKWIRGPAGYFQLRSLLGMECRILNHETKQYRYSCARSFPHLEALCDSLSGREWQKKRRSRFLLICGLRNLGPR